MQLILCNSICSRISSLPLPLLYSRILLDYLNSIFIRGGEGGQLLKILKKNVKISFVKANRSVLLDSLLKSILSCSYLSDDVKLEIYRPIYAVFDYSMPSFTDNHNMYLCSANVEHLTAIQFSPFCHEI